MSLTFRAEWRAAHGHELEALLTPFLDGPSPIYRFLACRALPGLYPDRDVLFIELQRRLLGETDRHIATHLLSLLGRFVPSRANDVDTLRQLASRADWACATSDPDADQRTGRNNRWALVVNLLATLTVLHATPYADETVRSWLTRPVDHSNRAAQTATRLRDLLNPADPSLHTAQERAFQLLALSPHRNARSACQVLSRWLETSDNNSIFASGARDDADTAEGASRGDLRRFSTLALPLLEQLTEVTYPAVTHHIVKTADQLRRVQPRWALLIAARAIANDSAYSREQLAVDAVQLLVRHYLSDHREVVLGDATCLSAIRAMLETFVRVGWDKAIELAEDLDNLFG